jgi:hypothetical protein
MFKQILLLSTIALFLFSCKDKEVEIPSYLVINDIGLNTTDVNQGSSSHSISDAYVFVNDLLIGIYDLPAIIPVQNEGRVTVKIGGGIKQNGEYTSRLEYPFYTRYQTVVNLVRGEFDTLNPVLEYTANTKFNTFLENFDNSISFENGPNSDVPITRITDSLITLEGPCGGVILDQDNEYRFDFFTPTISEIPRYNSSPVYLELDFKGNIFVNVGALYNDKFDNEIAFILPPKDDWTKVYINLSNLLGSYGGASNFNFFFAFSRTSTSFTGKAEFYIDNVKIIHY